MKTIYLKIHDFDEQSGSLLFSCASSATNSQNPDDYGAYAFNNYKHAKSVDDIVREIETIAAAQVEMVEEREALEKNTIIKTICASMVGLEHTFEVQERNMEYDLTRSEREEDEIL